ncbi:MAG: hypothetical protein MI674_06365 [Cytophagales bacterium]|nr:hypothetical protein [Cytophagales bacterium]
MDESDSDAEAPPKPAPAKILDAYVDDDNDQDKYPYEGIFASAQEKAEIYAMSMLEREQILADRTAEVERRRQNRLLRQLVSNQESEEKKHKKRKADSAGLDEEESVHKPTQLRSKRPASSAYDELKRARAAKGDRMRIREEERQNGRPNDRRPTSRNSNFSEQDHYDNRHPTTSRSKSPDPSYSREPATLRDIEHVRVGRSNFAQICFYPAFEETMVGCFSRVSVGPDENGIPKYKMARVKEITKGKPYAIQYRSTQIVTDQYAVLAHGKAAREWPFLMLSDGRFTDVS